MSWFDPNNKNFDAASFDYGSEQLRLQQQQAMAKALQSMRMPKGQMVSGRYVAPQLGAQLATALANVYGAYKQDQVADNSRELNNQSAEALAWHLKNPSGRATPAAPDAYAGNPPSQAVQPPVAQAYPIENAPYTGVAAQSNGGPLGGAIAARDPQAGISGGQGGYQPQQVSPTQEPPQQAPAQGMTQGDQFAYLTRLARTGPLGQTLAQQALNAQFAGKGEYDMVKGDDGQFAVFSKRTGQFQTVGERNPNKTVQTIETPNGVFQQEGGQWKPATTAGGQQLPTKAQADHIDKQREKAAEISKSIADGESQLQDFTQGVELIAKVGTGRLQTPWNNMMAYVTDSTDLDNLTRLFSQEKLQAARRFLQGQGSVTEAERRLIAEGSFSPTASTQANLDYANTLIRITRRVLGEQQKQLSLVQGGANPTAQPSVPGRRQQFSESDLGGL